MTLALEFNPQNEFKKPGTVMVLPTPIAITREAETGVSLGFSC